MRPGTKVQIHYAHKNTMPDPKWRDRFGIVLGVSRPGPHPRNVLVQTHVGLVVVPFWNVRKVVNNELAR